jgi:hypothetical protein
MPLSPDPRGSGRGRSSISPSRASAQRTRPIATEVPLRCDSRVSLPSLSLGPPQGGSSISPSRASAQRTDIESNQHGFEAR